MFDHIPFDLPTFLILSGCVFTCAFLTAVYFKNQLKKQKDSADAAYEEVLGQLETTQGLLLQEKNRSLDLNTRLEAEQAAHKTFERFNEETKLQVRESQQKAEKYQVEIRDLTALNSQLQTRLEEQQKSHEEKIISLENLKKQIDQDMKILTGEALQSNQKTFIDMANQVFEKHKETANTDLSRRKEEIQTLLKPISQTLDEYQKNLDIIEKNRRETVGNLSGELKRVIETQTEVRNETSKLVNALRAAPKTRGRWGEETLKNVMELSGMTRYCDFLVEESFNTEEGKLRPDVIINLPGERHIVVDAKTSTSAYMDAIEATDDVEREAYLKKHTDQLKKHMNDLASKSYQNGLTVTPDFVAMFVPGDNFFSAAMERDPDLFETAVKKGVLIVTPTTLIALAKAVAFGWRQEKVADNARKVSEIGQTLYTRLAKMGGHVLEVGKALDKSVKKYNDMVGSLEKSVMPQARKFNELEVEGTSEEIPHIPHAEETVREIRRDSDLEVPQLPFQNK